MIKRSLQNSVEKSLESFPVVGILGSRQVGKTTLSKEIALRIPNAVYLDMEYPPDYNKLNEAVIFFESHRSELIIIDEIQRRPELFQILRAVVDRDRMPCRFLILGSASPNLIKQASETLAGRIIYHVLPTLNITELRDFDNPITKLWLQGGFPLGFLSDEDISFRWRQAFISTYLERDIPQLGIKIASNQLRNFWIMLAHNHGQIWNASQIGGSLGISYHTANYYLNLLSDLFLVRILQPFRTNIKKRLIKSPKVYLRDSGILHALLNIKYFDELSGHPVIGHSFEGFVIEQIAQLLPAGKAVNYYRTSNGSEVDLVITSANKPEMMVEIKYSLTPRIGKGFINAIDDFGLENGYVIYPGGNLFRQIVNILAGVNHVPEFKSKIVNCINKTFPN
jgi:predicted AAA+ superfamily ATPase